MLWMMLLFAAAAAHAEIYIPASEAMAIEKPPPPRPAVAKQMKISGTVAAQVRIDESGAVTEVKVLQGNALLASAVVRVLKTWKFKPFEWEGKPATVVTTLRFSFK